MGGATCKLCHVFDRIKHYAWRIRRKIYYHTEKGRNQKTQISHVTYYAVGNAGDTVLSQCVRRTINSWRKSCWNLINVSDPVDAEVISSINRSSALIIGGGGLFLPDTNENDISGWQWAISDDLLESINVPIIVFTVGYNYFNNQEIDNLFVKSVIHLCKKADFIGLRNRGSVYAIQELLPERLKEKVRFQPCTTTIIRKIYGNRISIKKDSRKVAINMAFDRSERRFSCKKEEICRACAGAMKKIETMGFDIVLVYHCPDDSEFKSYLDEINVNYEVKDLSLEFPDKVYEFYNGIHCVLGMRGHAQMIPFGLNCGIITLGTHNKMRWFLEDINMKELYIDITEDLESLSERITMIFELHMVKNYKITQEKLIEAQNELMRITQTNMKEIQKLL